MQANRDTDVYDHKLGTFIDPKTLKMLSKITPWRGILQIGLEWFGIVAAIMVCKAYWNPLLYLVTVVWIGTRQNGLGIMSHEAAHYRLLPNRAWNDWIGEIFAAWPLLVSMNGYRQTHFPHHRHTNKPEDPDRQMLMRDPARYYPTSMHKMVIITLKYLVGYYAIAEFKALHQESILPPKVKYLRLAFYVIILITSIMFHFWLGILMYWLLPLFTYFLWVIFIRSMTEHSQENYDDLLKKTRHVNANWIERLMIAPNGIYLHTAHHLYPSIPFYNLKKAHAILMKNQEFVRRAHISKNYFALIKETIEANHKLANAALLKNF